MKCLDCGGSGKYQGFNVTVPEPCEKCGGDGTLDDNGKKHTLQSQSIKRDLPDWMEPYRDRLAENDLLDITHKITEIKPAPKVGMSPPTNKLLINDPVYVYDMQWFKGRVIHFSVCRVKILYFESTHPRDPIVKINQLCWNDTQQR